MTDWIISYIATYGYFGVAALMFAENVFPPIPSEVILPFVGQSVAQGELNFVLALAAATIGSLFGTLLWFLLGWYLPAIKLENFLRKYGGYVAISHHDFLKATAFFEKYKISAVFFGRMLPGIRTVISLPAGSVHMSVKYFILYSALGSLLWNTGLMAIGYLLLNDFAVVEDYISPVTNSIIIVLVLLYVSQVIRFIWLKNTQKHS